MVDVTNLIILEFVCGFLDFNERQQGEAEVFSCAGNLSVLRRNGNFGSVKNLAFELTEQEIGWLYSEQFGMKSDES